MVNRRRCHLTENLSLKVQCSKVTKLEQCRIIVCHKNEIKDKCNWTCFLPVLASRHHLRILPARVNVHSYGARCTVTVTVYGPRFTDHGLRTTVYGYGLRSRFTVCGDGLRLRFTVTVYGHGLRFTVTVYVDE